MSLIAIDIGNSSFEVAVFKNDSIIYKFHIASNELSWEELKLNIDKKQELFNNKVVIISSVIPSINLQVKDFLEKNYNLLVFILNSKDYNLILQREQGLDSVGMDIICKSAAIIKNYQQDALILDVGTATVLQYIKDKSLVGVAISLGLGTIYRNLNTNTALLPLITPEKTEKVLGSDTSNAIKNGVFWSYVGGINTLVNMAKKEVNCNNIFFTGGLSYLIKDDLLFDFIYDPNLIFYGIKVIYDENINLFHNLN